MVGALLIACTRNRLVVPELFGVHTGAMAKRVFPEAVPDISIIAGVLANRSRAAMCAALMSGRAWTVSELAAHAGITRSTASEHIDTLVSYNIAAEVRQGRHRYIRLAGQDAAHLIETLGVATEAVFLTPNSLRAVRAQKDFVVARLCYRHVAGKLGVDIAHRLMAQGALTAQWQVSESGIQLLTGWGIPRKKLRATPCMDSIERQFHVGGALGVGMCDAFFRRGWIERIGDSRAIRLTEAGHSELHRAGLLPEKK